MASHEKDPSRELHPRLSAAQKQHLIEHGRRLFNRGRFYDCHEAWETVWRSTTPEPKDLWRGLIQIAVAFYHFHGRRRPDVALRVLEKGRRRVEPYAPRAEGLDLENLLKSVAVWGRYFEAGGRRPESPMLGLISDSRSSSVFSPRESPSTPAPDGRGGDQEHGEDRGPEGRGGA